MLNSFDFDILVITESLLLNLNYPYSYTTEKIPSKGIYENLDYGKYLNSNNAYRVVIYSKYEAVEILNVSDKHTSLALKFNSEFGDLNIYATIIGTWFNKLPYAKIELENCINDCLQIFEKYNSVTLIGDLNTSFCIDNKDYQINESTTNKIKNLVAKTNMNMSTAGIKHNIDHIFLTNEIASVCSIDSEIFIQKDFLSDHPGIVLNIHTSANRR